MAKDNYMDEMARQKQSSGTQTDEEIINDHITKLSTSLTSIPDIDVNQVFAPYLQKMQARQPQTPAPGKLESFARAFGSREGAQSVMAQLDKHREEKGKQEEDTLNTERQIIGMQLQQQMQKGQSRQALETLRHQKILDAKLGETKSARELKEWDYKQGVLGEQKKALQEQKANAAVNLAKEKATAIAKQFNLPQKMALLLVEEAGRMARTQMNAMFQYAPVGSEGRDVSVGDMSVVTGDFLAGLTARAQEMVKQGGAQPPPAAAPSATPAAPQKSRARQIWESKQPGNK